MLVEGDRGGEDDKEHHQVGEKRANAHVDVSQPKFFNRGSSALSKRVLARQLFLFDLFTCLPEEQVRANGCAEDCDQRCPLIAAVRHRWHQRSAQHLAPVGSYDKCGGGVGKKDKDQPLEHVCDLSILEPDCRP